MLFGEKLLGENANADQNGAEDEASEEDKDEDPIDLPELDIEKKVKEDSGSTAFDIGAIGTRVKLSATQTALLELVVPRAVYRNAVKVMISITSENSARCVSSYTLYPRQQSLYSRSMYSS